MQEIDNTTLLLKIPRNTKVTPEAAQTFLSALVEINYMSSIKKLFGNRPPAFALEIGVVNQHIGFQITCDSRLVNFVETQLQSNYPLVVLEKIKDPFINIEYPNIINLHLRKGNYYPIATYNLFNDIDPMSSILQVLSKAQANEMLLYQIAIESSDGNWQVKGDQYAQKGTKKEDGSYSPRPDANVIKEKISYPGFKTSIRLVGNTNITLRSLVNAFGVFTRSDGNSFTSSTPGRFAYKKEVDRFRKRYVGKHQALNIVELATLWHLPGEMIKTPSILWGTSVLSEAPSNLPVAINTSEEEKGKINFFAKTTYKNKETIFGIKDKDRLRHIWTVGKTGTGKSTMIANMAIDDARKSRGFGIIDPHGDLCEDVLDFVPSNRINQTIYFNPADKNFPITINPLEVTNREEAELVVSGLMAIFTKVWANVWSARMEYILRNSFLTLAEIPHSTLPDVLKLMSSQSYRNKVLDKINDDALIHFWREEFEKMPEKLQKEAIAPIQNKVGQFVTSPMIRRIISNPQSSISLEEIMDEEKIFLANLSQGRLGEDNAALLGAMLITKFQISAMRRVDKPKEQRVPFYLFVDEFQNFATSSFIKILSEARKYKLALFLANQYMAQIPEGVRDAILGNAGTLISFAAGAQDAATLHKEFAEVFEQNDLINMRNYQIAVKLMVDWHSTRPFLAHTLPLPDNKTNNREKIIRVSRERWAKKVSEKKEKENLDKSATNQNQGKSGHKSKKAQGKKQDKTSGKKKSEKKENESPPQNSQSETESKLANLQNQLKNMQKGK